LDRGSGIAVDSASNIYVTGNTDSLDLPKAINSSFGSQDAFVTKFSSTGEVIFSTYLGGSNIDGGQGIAIAVDSANNVNVYVVGSTHSLDFPKVNALDSELGGKEDAFVTKLLPTGEALFSTYLGGSKGSDSGSDIAVDGDGNICVTGNTESSDFPIIGNAHSSVLGEPKDAFVTKFSPAGEVLFSTYLGGSKGSDSGSDIAVDGAGNVYVTGNTAASDFRPTGNALDSELGGEENAFVTKLSPTGKVLFSTYLGGSDIDKGQGIAVDNANNIYVTGDTQSLDFPPVKAHSSALRGPNDAFVVKITPNVPPEVKEPPQQSVLGGCLTPPTPEPPSEKKKGLVFITHGWNSNPEEWAKPMAESIQAITSGNPTIDWQFCVYDWHEDAKAVTGCENGLDLSCYFDHRNAYVNAINHGEKVAKEIIDQQYDYDSFHCSWCRFKPYRYCRAADQTIWYQQATAHPQHLSRCL
jgi:uncharacterized protein (AIM24 family)